MKRTILSTLAIGGILVLFSLLIFADEDEWVEHKSEQFGIKFKLPASMDFRNNAYTGGWKGISAQYKGLQIWAVNKPGSPESAKTIETFGRKVTGMRRRQWRVIDEGRNINGWKWYKMVRADSRRAVAYGGYGTGPRGSYLIILKTSKSDFDQYRSNYERWYKSIRLF